MDFYMLNEKHFKLLETLGEFYAQQYLAIYIGVQSGIKNGLVYSDRFDIAESANEITMNVLFSEEARGLVDYFEEEGA